MQTEAPCLEVVYEQRVPVDTIIAFDVSHDGVFFAAGSPDDEIFVYDARTGEKRCELAGHTGGTNSLKFIPARKARAGRPKTLPRLASAGEDGTLKIWDLSGGEPLHTFVCEGVDADKGFGGWTVTNVAVNATGTQVACSAGKTVHLFWPDAQDGAENAGLLPPVDGGVVSALSFTRRGNLLFSWYGGLSWAPAEAGTRALVFENTNHFLCAAASPDERWFVGGVYDSTVHIWRMEGPDESGRCKTVEMNCGGFQCKVTVCNWQPGKASVLMASCGGASCCVWDFTGEGPAGSTPVVAGGGHGDVITCQAWRHDGSKWMATAAKDGSVAVFDIAQQAPKQGPQMPATCTPLAGHEGDDDAAVALAWPTTDLVVAAFESGVVRAFRVPADVLGSTEPVA